MLIDIGDLGEVEQWIAQETVKRLRDGQRIFGKWILSSKDDFYESVMEVLDRNNYMAAGKLKRLEWNRALTAADDHPISSTTP